ncbi:hypothetical protein BO82DRAFT_48043 [Aspergillus uvarum CBS 121591]|uniref:Uncharacterized protein n=1 Tax=Aspergillus uvarum CBS 121591 TaxID=1448315 RepID=A0A319CVM4_9EURO|nr:hypothetical protein BO82DRAFT_48043 [Aspergillus uvarum CBS 121591]PYH82923.1 hypothetical protein BO82DRAFT_48043 [Aspergillus uvarum CBS 121591]
MVLDSIPLVYFYLLPCSLPAPLRLLFPLPPLLSFVVCYHGPRRSPPRRIHEILHSTCMTPLPRIYLHFAVFAAPVAPVRAAWT